MASAVHRQPGSTAVVGFANVVRICPNLMKTVPRVVEMRWVEDVEQVLVQAG
jgi:hypothetical protein